MTPISLVIAGQQADMGVKAHLKNQKERDQINHVKELERLQKPEKNVQF